MSIILENVTNVESKLVALVAKATDPVTEGVTKAVDFIDAKITNVPAVPFADKLPTPQEVADSQFDFAKKLLETNKSVVDAVLVAVAPLSDRLLDRKTKAKKVTKTAAKAA